MKRLILELGTDTEGFAIEYDKKKKALYFSVWTTDKVRHTYREILSLRGLRGLRGFRERVRFFKGEQ